MHSSVSGILGPAPPSASAAYVEAVRVRRAILRALRRRLRSRLQLRDAAEFAKCDAPTARNALETLKVARMVVEKVERGGPKHYELTALGMEHAEP